MADLILTIDDSDSEAEQKNTAKKQNKPNEVEEEILLAHSVILKDTDNAERKFTSGHITGSNNLWKFSESLQIDRKTNIVELDDATTADEKAPFLLTIEERAQAKLEEKNI